MIRLIFLIAICLPFTVFGCSCANNTLQNKIVNADYIYFGQITESKLINSNTIENNLSIIDFIKGNPETNIIYSRVGEHTMCSMYAATGLTYIVYGKLGTTPSLSLCSSTMVLLDDVEKELEEIRLAVNNAKLDGFE